jgi:hypothetical protein
MIENYKDKFLYLYDLQHKRCPVCNCYFVEGLIKADLHHKMRNTKGNREKYKLLIDSILNLQVIPSDCHINKHGKCGTMTDLEARRIETYLQNNPEVEKFVNNPNFRDFDIEEIMKEIFEV